MAIDKGPRVSFLLRVFSRRPQHHLTFRACLLLFAAVVSSSARSHASEPNVALAYDSPWQCPNRDQFWQQLQARSKRLTELDQVGTRILIDARIAGSGSVYHGHLRLMETNSPVVERDVGGTNCVDVSAALALITAVTLDAAHASVQPNVSVTQRPKEAPKRWAVGALAGVDTVVAPNAVPTFGLSLTYRETYRFGSPEFRVAALFAESRWASISDGGQAIGDARFTWLASRATACLFQLQLASTTVGPCALLELGALRGEGRVRDAVQTSTGWWFAPGAMLNASVQTDPVWLRLAAGAVVPVIRDKFQFNPNPLAFQPVAVGLSAELELAWAFQ